RYCERAGRRSSEGQDYEEFPTTSHLRVEHQLAHRCCSRRELLHCQLFPQGSLLLRNRTYPERMPNRPFARRPQTMVLVPAQAGLVSHREKAEPQSIVHRIHEGRYVDRGCAASLNSDDACVLRVDLEHMSCALFLA